jgi:hypothetical protein
MLEHRHGGLRFAERWSSVFVVRRISHRRRVIARMRVIQDSLAMHMERHRWTP